MDLEIVQSKCLEQQNNETIEKNQNKFLETRLGKITNTALDVGLKMILPDFIENEIIELKDTILNNGLKDGIKTAINSAIDLGKNIINIATGDFKEVSQVKDAIKKGGLIDKVSLALKEVITITQKKGFIDKSTAKKIENGKETILDTISESIEKDFSEQVKSGEKIEKYIENWKNCFGEENLNGMQKELKKIKKESEKVMPFENTSKEIEKIENIQNLIESKNGDFNLSDTEKELIERLS